LKALFAGPSLYGDIVGGRIAAAPGIVCCGPAAQGDVAAAVLDGATAIALVDGRCEDVAAPWPSTAAAASVPCAPQNARISA
jgi:hypothetical protein